MLHPEKITGSICGISFLTAKKCVPSHVRTSNRVYCMIVSKSLAITGTLAMVSQSICRKTSVTAQWLTNAPLHRWVCTSHISLVPDVWGHSMPEIHLLDRQMLRSVRQNTKIPTLTQEVSRNWLLPKFSHPPPRVAAPSRCAHLLIWAQRQIGKVRSRCGPGSGARSLIESAGYLFPFNASLSISS